MLKLKQLIAESSLNNASYMNNNIIKLKQGVQSFEAILTKTLVKRGRDKAKHVAVVGEFDRAKKHFDNAIIELNKAIASFIFELK